MQWAISIWEQLQRHTNMLDYWRETTTMSIRCKGCVKWLRSQALVITWHQWTRGVALLFIIIYQLFLFAALTLFIVKVLAG